MAFPFTQTSAALGGLLVLFVVWVLNSLRPVRDTKLPVPTKHGIPYFGTTQFFREPATFIINCLSWAGDSMFAFKIKWHTVIVLRGVSGKNAMFTKGLDFMAGYRLLNPQLVDVMPAKKLTGDESWATFFATKFLATEIMQLRLPFLIRDVCVGTSRWGNQGIVDPFEDICQLVFRVAARISTCQEICDSEEKLNALVKIFAHLDAGSTPSAVILPWIPTPSRVRRLLAGKDLYMMLAGIVKDRKRTKKIHNDPLQTLMDMDLTVPEIVRFIATTLFAAVANTSAVMAWLLIFLQLNPDWKRRIQQEIDDFVRRHSTNVSTTLEESLGDVPLSEWDTGVPSLDLCINEALRLVLTGTMMRRNIGEDLMVDGLRIRHGAFLMYPTQDLHFHPGLYPEPETFNPLRWQRDAVDERFAKVGLNFLGWGAKPHACVGKRVALLMMRLVLVCIMYEYDATITDRVGRPLSTQPDRHMHLFKVGIPKEPVQLHYTKRPRNE